MERCEWCGSAKSVHSTTSLQANKVGPSLCAVCEGNAPIFDVSADDGDDSRQLTSKTNFVSWNLNVISAAQLLTPHSY